MSVWKRGFSIGSIGLLVVSWIFLLAGCGPALELEADRAYTNGTIYTVDENFSTASALAVKDGEFVYVGDDRGARAYIGPNTSVVDLEGRTIIPGLHDAHVHIRYGEMTMDEVFISDEAATQGYEVENTGTEPLVTLRYFGPDTNPQAPSVGDYKK